MQHLDILIEKAFQSSSGGHIYRSIIDDTERLLIQKALEQSRGNQLMAARLLGMNRNTLHSKIKKLKISVEKGKYRNSRMESYE